MWQEDKNVWLHYVKNIIASDLRSAVHLASLIRMNSITKKHAKYMEVIDLQQYKVIKSEAKVRAAMTTLNDTPFVFFVGKN